MAGREVIIKSVALVVQCIASNSPLLFIRCLILLLSIFGGVKRMMSIRSIGKFEIFLAFRSLSEYNTALLAKQVWTLHSEPEVFWAKVLKGIYYPNYDVLKVGKGSTASWAWSNLLKEKAFPLEGIRWQVGNGNSIDIWQDKWLINSKFGSLRPFFPVYSNAPSKVAKIIN